MNAYIDPQTAARIRNLPRNRRIGAVAPEAPKPTEIEVWKDGFGVGLFFGSVLVDVMFLAAHYLNG